jgi:hypothetical protein
MVEHIPHPCVGWYYCGYIPRHRNGVPIPRTDDGERTKCKRCLRVRAHQVRTGQYRGAHGIVAEGNLLGAIDV